MYQLKMDKCSWCGNSFKQDVSHRQLRSDKKFCSASHRSAYNRWLKNIEKRERQASDAIKKLCEYVQHPMAAQTAVESIVRVRELIRCEAQANGLRIVE